MRAWLGTSPEDLSLSLSLVLAPQYCVHSFFLMSWAPVQFNFTNAPVEASKAYFEWIGKKLEPKAECSYWTCVSTNCNVKCHDCKRLFCKDHCMEGHDNTKMQCSRCFDKVVTGRETSKTKSEVNGG